MGFANRRTPAARAARAGLLAIGLVAAWAVSGAEAVTAKDREYLNTLARDTWACIDYFKAPETGFPYDSNLRPTNTNTTNIGLHLSCIVAAYKMGFLKDEEARQRISRILTSLKRVDAWHGFYNNHLDTSGKTQARPGLNALSDFNMLPAGLIVVRQAFPDLTLADELYRRIEWARIWDKSANRLNQGFDVTDGKQAYWGPGWLASDVRMAVFLGVASGAFPPEAFDRMERNTVTQYGLTFYRPAWDYAGLFMHALAGLFLDERGTPIGDSAANFAYAQMLFARDAGYPAWGWSACDRPGEGYTVNGLLSTTVITPHASALMLAYYPEKVISNLKKLDVLGCRRPYIENNRKFAFGFRDSINLTTGEVSDLYFAGLDQAMLFIALANYLKPGCLQNLFLKDPTVQAGIAKLAFYRQPDAERLRLYGQRDAQMLSSELDDQARGTAEELVVDTFMSDPNTNLGMPRKLWMERAPYSAVQISLDDTGEDPALKVEYDFTNHPQANAVLSEPLNGIDGRNFNAIAFKCRAETEEGVANFRLKLTDSIQSRTVGFVEGLSPQWQEVLFPFEVLRGIPADLAHLSAIEFRLECSPNEFPDKALTARKGTLYLSRLRLVRLGAGELKARVRFYQTFGSLVIGEHGQMEGLNRLEGWQSYQDADSEIHLKVINHTQNYLEISYALSPKGKWVACEKNFKQTLNGNFELGFDIKGTGTASTLEVKLFAAGGAVYGVNLPRATASADWRRVTLTRGDFQHLWGGKPGDQLVEIQRFGFAVSGTPKSSGVCGLRNLTLTEKKK